MNLLDVFLIFVVLLIMVIIISVIFLAFTTGFKNTGRQTGGLYGLIAAPSNGKSYVVTAIAVDFMRQGRNVFSNFPIVYQNGREYYETKVLTKEMLLNENLSQSVLIIDEAHRWFWSRDFKKFGEEYKNWFSTLAQKRYHVIMYYSLKIG